MGKRLRWFAVAATVGMFVVLLQGATVTATESGEGCGRHWPLCYGEVLPQETFESVTEYTHRFVTGVEGILVLIVSVGAWRLRKAYRELTVLVPLMAGTIVLQSGMGAAAVMWPQSPPIMATHFGISLICLAATYLVARVLFQADAATRNPRSVTRAERSVPDGFRTLLVACLVASVVVAYLGAYVRHTESQLVVTDWPLYGGGVFPGLGDIEPQYIHRLSAVVITALIGALAWWAYRLRDARPDLFAIAKASAWIVGFQSLVGGLIVVTEVQVLTTLAHAALMALLFMFLADGVRATLPAHWRAPARRQSTDDRRQPALSPGD